MNSKFVKWQLKAWLVPLIILGVYGLLAIVLPRLSENYIVTGDVPEYLARNSISSAIGGFANMALSTGVFLSLILTIISSDYKWKRTRYDAYAQLPLCKNGIKRHRMILSLALVGAMFTLHYWLGTGTFALRWLSLKQAASSSGGIVGEFDFMPILLSYLLGLVGLSAVHLTNFAIASMSHSLWSALMMLLLGNLVITLGPTLVLGYFFPFFGRSSIDMFAYGSVTGVDVVYRLSDIFSKKAAFIEPKLSNEVLISLVVGGVVTLGLGVGSFFYVFFRKEMSGEYCGGKSFDTFGKTLFPHAFALVVAFAIGQIGAAAGKVILASGVAVAIIEMVFILLGYFVLLFVYFLTLKIGKWQWIIAGGIVVLAVVLFLIGVLVAPQPYVA